MAQNPAEASRQRAARLKEVFRDVAPIEITGIVDLGGKSPKEIAALLPRFTVVQQKGENPAFGILVDPATQRAWSLRSGFSPHLLATMKGISFRMGIMTRDVARVAGKPWFDDRVPLAAHVEGQAAAFLRAMDINHAVLHINASSPCLRGGIGCWYRLPLLLPEGATLIVYNKDGQSCPPFIGLPD